MGLNDINSLSHTKWNSKYHRVFAPKYRRKVFYKDKRAEVGKILRQLCEWKGVKIILCLVIALIVCLAFSTTDFAAGDVAGAIEGTWNDASEQIKTVVNKVVFPAIDLILAIFSFAKLGMAYFDYRKSEQFEWTGSAILFACLIFRLTAPTYIWTILGL